MALKRFVCRDLYKYFHTEKDFIDTVAKYLASEAISKKEAEQTIVAYYTKNTDLLVKLDRWMNE